MAKWGEGDPRWIVEERPDATNVNNWHWTEKNATPWSKERIRTLFDDFRIEENHIQCKITKMSKVDGEASANNRKGKLIFFYEWNVVMKWEGCLPDQVKASTGEITIPNLSEENDLDDIEITITIDDLNSDEGTKLKQFMYNVGRSHIRKQLGVYLKELREEFSKGIILPKKDDLNKNSTVKPDSVSNITSGFNKKITMDPIVSKDLKPLGYKLAVTDIVNKETFQCQAKDLYEVLTNEAMVSAFTSGKCKMDATKGGKFELFGGNIHGEFEELVPYQKITQTWRCNQWPAGHYSKVVFEFKEKTDHTRLKITQTGVPENEKDATMKNWKLYYWNSIKQTFRYGSYIS